MRRAAWPPTGHLSLKGRQMRKFHVAGSAVAALSLVLTASAFASPATVTARPAATPVTVSDPGQPMVPASGYLAPASSAASNSSTGSGPATSSIIDSTNWAGYAAAHPGTAFRYIRATFFVPYVDCATTPNAFSSHWVGLDGLNSKTVEQLGIESGCSGATTQYYAWYEMYPGNESSVFTVKPGNSIVASVYYNQRTKMFVLTLSDTTTGQHFSRSQTCAATSCTRSSAQVISESPAGSSGQALPLADYRACSFSGISVTDSFGHHGTLRSKWWNTYEVIETDGSSGVAGQPSSLYRGAAFDNYWFRET
jgi:peptidase A4-like protein